MTREQMASLIERRTDAMNRHDVAAVGEVYAVDCRVESPMAASTVVGRHAVSKVTRALFDAFPDLRFEPDIVLIEGSSVAVSGWLSGTYTGGFMGLAPSGKPVRLPLVTISTAADGQIVTERRVYDLTGMLVQAGILKARSA